jgi:hypothetical protein
MVAAIKQQVTVQPGGVIEIRSPELKPGTSAEVIVLVEDQPSSQRTWASFIGSGRGQFKSVEEIDAYIRELRDEWDR